jgi:peptide/nickel transport system ATP-binding protein
MSEAALLEARGLVKVYAAAGRGNQNSVCAVDHVSFDVRAGEILGVVGESGSGKTTVARLITRIEQPTDGTIWFKGEDIYRLRGPAFRHYRRNVQMVFQDPYAALNPFNTVEYTLMRPLIRYERLSVREARRRVRELLTTVQLTPVEDFLPKRPDELSGGQRQRVVIARAIATNPALIVADEPVSMLDVSIRAGVLQLLDTLRTEHQLGIVYITHDLLSARLVADRVMVMYRGRVVEDGPTQQVIARPLHPYTQQLVAAIPHPDKRYRQTERRVLAPAPEAADASTASQTSGCLFYARCPIRTEVCLRVEPELKPVSASEHRIACHGVTDASREPVLTVKD